MAEETEQQQPVAAAAPTVPAPPAEPVEPAPVLSPNFTRAYGTGRRKEAVARVYLLPGSGKFTVNGRTVEDFFPRQTLRFVVFQPLDATNTKALFDVRVTVRGGGPMGQASATRLGVARALLEYTSAKSTVRRALASASSSRSVNGSRGPRVAVPALSWRCFFPGLGLWSRG